MKTLLFALLVGAAMQFAISIEPYSLCTNKDEMRLCHAESRVCVTSGTSSACVEAYDNPNQFDCACTSVEKGEHLPCRNETDERSCKALHGVCVSSDGNVNSCAEYYADPNYLSCVCIIPITNSTKLL